MKTNMRFLGSAIAVIAIVISVSQCKSPTTQQDASAVPVTDTAVAAVDTGQTVVSEGKDTAAKQAPLTLIINNLASTTAPVIVGVYGAKNKFPDPKDQLKVYTFVPESASMTAFIKDLPFGTYALAIYQDVNNNGKIDKNLIGIPTEPYAFSNNYKPMVKAPGFKNCQFDYTASANSITMKMIR